MLFRSARMHDEATALAIVDAFLTAPFAVARDAVRHERRIAKISAYEASRTI